MLRAADLRQELVEIEHIRFHKDLQGPVRPRQAPSDNIVALQELMFSRRGIYNSKGSVVLLDSCQFDAKRPERCY